MSRKMAIFSLLVGLVLVFGLNSLAAAAPLKVGAQVGNLKFARASSPADQAYLGLKKAGEFTLQDIQAKYVLIEVLNVNCPHCMEQAEALNRLYRLVEGSDLKERVKFLAVVCNSEAGANKWRKAFKVPFALVSDPEWQIAGCLNISGTPTTVVVNKSGKIIVLHDGVFGDANKAFKDLKAKLK